MCIAMAAYVPRIVCHPGTHLPETGCCYYVSSATLPVQNLCALCHSSWWTTQQQGFLENVQWYNTGHVVLLSIVILWQ